MRLLGFQEEVVASVVDFHDAYRHVASVHAAGHLDVDPGPTAWQTLGSALPIPATERPYSSLQGSTGPIPHCTICIPTGGGKTVTGLHTAIRVAQDITASEHGTPAIVWLVPSTQVYDQVFLAMLPHGYLHTYVQEVFGLNLLVKRNTDAWSASDLDSGAVLVLLLTHQSIVSERDELKVMGSADLVSALPFWSEEEQPSVLGSLEHLRAVWVIDEAHHLYTSRGRRFLESIRGASFVLELTATPRPYGTTFPNVVASVPAQKLIEEALIKFPLVYDIREAWTLSDLMAEAVDERQALEDALVDAGFTVRPKVLISGASTGEGGAAHPASVQSLRQHLLDLGVPASQIAIKSAYEDDLATLGDLDSPDCEIAFILTKAALNEGWDCKSVFMVLLLNGVDALQTTVQLVGRGMRQPGRRYFEVTGDRDLNALQVWSNDSSPEEVLSKLKSFLEEQGLRHGSLLVGSMSGAALQVTPVSPVTFPAPHATLETADARVLSRVASGFTRWSLSRLEPYLPPPAAIQGIIGLAAERDRQAIHDLERPPVDPQVLALELTCVLGLLLGDSRAAHRLSKQLATEFATGDVAGRTRFPLASLVRAARDLLNVQIADERQRFFSEVVYPTADVVRARFPLNRESVRLPIAEPGRTVAFQKHILGGVSADLFNQSELEFAQFLDGLPEIRWLRNLPGPEGLGVPHARGTFFPDFLVLCDELAPGEFGRAVFIETKGAHLAGSLDTVSKQEAAEGFSRLDGVDFILGEPQECRAALGHLLA